VTGSAERIQSGLSALRRAEWAAAREFFEAALTRLHTHEQSLLAGRARLEMGLELRNSDWAGAVSWVKAALATFERIGATREADEAAKLLRDLGVVARSGPRLRGKLTQREEEVLDLVARGLSNREIAGRLFISAKTAEHHVGQILEKLGARSRSEAAAMVASINLQDLPPRTQ
jgi:DNA-binding NarL/FixJ family response regulator